MMSNIENRPSYNFQSNNYFKFLTGMTWFGASPCNIKCYKRQKSRQRVLYQAYANLSQLTVQYKIFLAAICCVKNIILIVISAMDLPSLSMTSSASSDKEKYIEAVINIYFNRPVAIESAIQVHAFPDLAFYVLNLRSKTFYLSRQCHLLIIKG